MRRKVAKELVAAITKKLFDNEAELVPTDKYRGLKIGEGVELRRGLDMEGWNLFWCNTRVHLPFFVAMRLGCAADTYLLIKAKAALGDSGGQDAA